MIIYVSTCALLAGSTTQLDITEASNVAVEEEKVLASGTCLQDADLADAFIDAGYSLLAFSMAAIVIKGLNYRQRKKTARSAATRKIGNVIADVAQDDDSVQQRLVGGQFRAEVVKASRETVEVKSEAFEARQQQVPNARGASVYTLRGSKQGRVSENDVLAAAVRAGKSRDLPRLLDAAKSRAIAEGIEGLSLQHVMAQYVLSALRSCASRRCFREALDAYDYAADYIGRGCCSTWSLLLYSAVEAKEFARCQDIFEKLCQSGTPSGNDFVNVVRYHAMHLRNATKLKNAIAVMQDTGFCLDVISRNRAIAVCTSNAALDLAEFLATRDACASAMDAVGYNTLMKGYAQMGDFARCFQIYSTMHGDGCSPSEITFGIMLDACIDATALDRARQVFEDLRNSGLQLNVVHYTTFMKGLTIAGQLGEATQILDEMLASPTTKPDLVTYSTLVKAYADSGKVMDAIRIIERMFAQSITPDTIILNMVLTGCCATPMEPAQIFHVYKWLSHHGLQTSTTTLSILVKALAKNNAFAEALNLLDEAVQRFNIWPEARLYTQLAQACAKPGHALKTVDVYASMVKSAAKQGIAVDDATNSRLYRLCSQYGDSAVATKIYNAVTRAGGYTEAAVITELLMV